MNSKQQPFDPKSYIARLSHRPGVYRMLDADGELLYVGKAKDLKKRVAGYFGRGANSAKTAAMVNQVASIEVTITHTEDEALLLESSLIKRYRPRYNIVLRDDKSYPYLYISGDHDFPRLAFHRGAQSRPGQYFGPYPSAGAVRSSQNTIHKLFRLRQCSNSFFANRSRPCLQYQIKRCSAPCVGLIDRESYAEDVQDAIDLLEGRTDRLLKQLIRRMEAAAEALEYEQAAHYREKIASIKRLQEQEFISGFSGSFDIVVAGVESGLAGVVIVTVRNGQHLGHRSHFPKTPAEVDPAELLAAFIGQYYQDRQPPQEILVDPKPADLGWLEQALSHQAKHKVRIKHRLQSRRAHWLKQAKATLRQSIDSRLASRAGAEASVAALQEALDLESPPARIECFDISHTAGESAVAGCVVFVAGVPQKSAYRRFNIKDITPGDDYAALRQALERRFLRVRAGEVTMPDLVLIDGGRGQLHVAEEVLASLDLAALPLVAVSKGEGRKPGRERLHLPLALSAGEAPLILPPDSAALLLIQQIRDEAHRFAITGHRGKRAKARKKSSLDEIAGLGPVRKRRLLKAFGGPRQVSRAGTRELARVEGISKALAQRIYDHFH